MTRQRRILPACDLAAPLLFVAGAERAAAVAYKATIISPMGYDNSEAIAISGNSIVGIGDPSPGLR